MRLKRKRFTEKVKLRMNVRRGEKNLRAGPPPLLSSSLLLAHNCGHNEHKVEKENEEFREKGGRGGIHPACN